MPEGAPSTSGPALAPTLGPGSEFHGLLVLRGPGRIDGTVRGEIVAAGRVWIGPEGCVEARVEAEELVVEGRLAGEVRARRRIDLRATARVEASIQAPQVRLEEGARLDGPCRTTQPGAPRAEAAPAEARSLAAAP
jgi:cytoskeletal protein CcmA (bactofilin family)